MEKPNAFPLREPEFIKFPMTRVICSSWVKLWLFMSSSQAAVTDTTSGLMLFSCSSNCSLNRMAWSLFTSSFTVDIWREERGWADEILSKYICHHIDCVCFWVHEGDFIYYVFYAAEQRRQCSTAWGSVSNKYLQRSQLLKIPCLIFYYADFLCCGTCG